MKKDLKTLNKSVAIAIAAAMAATSAPTPLLASDFTDGGDFVSEAPAVDDSAEAAVQADGFGDESAVAAVTEDGFGDSEAITAEEGGTTDEITAADAEAPGKVTHVEFDKDDPNKLTWYADQKADRYQIKVTDEAGYVYYDSYYSDTNKPTEESYSGTGGLSYYLNYYRGYPTKTNADGTIEHKKNDNNGIVSGYLESGKTYTVSVRSVNYNSADNTTAYSEWSDPVSYTKAALVTPDQVSVSVKNNKILISGDQQQKNVRYEISIKDADGKEYFDGYDAEKGGQYARVWDSDSLSEIDAYVYKKNENGSFEPEKDAEGKEIKAFAIGKAYTIKVRAYVVDQNNSDTKLFGAWSNEVSATYTEKAVPEKTGNFKYEDKEVSWNDIDGASGYEVEVDGKTFNPEGSYFDVRLTYRTDKGEEVKFEQGKTYSVRVRSYNYKLADGTKQYSDWSDAFSFTYEATKDTSLKKISGLKYNGNNLTWNADENADKYQIKVTDASGREYFVNEVNNQGVYAESPYASYYLSGYGLNTYTTVDGVWVPVKHPATGEYVRAFEAGQTYTLSVRAVKYENGKEVYGEWSNTFEHKVKAQDTGINEKPATVTGLTIKTTADADETSLDGARLTWNYVENVEHYEVLVKDSAGREYVDYASVKEDGTIDFDYAYGSSGSDYYPYVKLSSLSSLRTYTKSAGVALDTVKDASGKDIKAMAPGETYTFQVRAVREYTVTDADGKTTTETLEGDWSAPSAAYTVSVAQTITDLQYAYADDDYYYFTFSANVKPGTVWYQLATDASFTAASVLTGWDQASRADYAVAPKFRISKDSSVLEAGKTYYVRAISSEDEPTPDEVKALNIASVTFTTDAEKTAKNITGLTLYRTNEDSFEFRFDAVLEEGDSYELQYTDKANAAEEDWAVGATNRATLSMSNLKEGTYYVRAISYIEKDGKKVYGAASNIVAVTVSKATSTISDLKFAEKTPEGYTFTYTGSIRKNETVEYWYSDTPDFASVSKATVIKDKYHRYDDDDERYADDNQVTLSFDSLTPGKKYYVRARVENLNAATDAQKYSAFTNAVTLTASLPRVNVYGTVITAKTVTLKMNAVSDGDLVSGYQIQRKNGKSYKTIAKTTDNVYKNSKLKSDTTYNYRVRPYYYDKETGKTTYGAWAYTQATTWGGALKVKAIAKSKTSVKVSWSKVKGAQGYEIYRSAGYSDTTNISAGKDDGFAKLTLVKTVSSKKSSYTDKKLASGNSYNYYVRAYKTVGNKKYYIGEYAYASLKFAMTEVNKIKYANGKVKLSWQPIYTSKGYVVEKYNEETDSYETIKTLKASTGSYMFPAAEKTTKYRVRAFSGNEYTNGLTVTVEPVVAAPTGVKAVANSKDGSITVTWNAVAGADYYRVYRTTSSWNLYNKDAQSYSHQGGRELNWYVADSTRVSGYRYAKEADMKATTFVDRPITYTVDGATNTEYEGPKAGVTYYYYVVAYKNGKAYNYEEGTTDSSYEAVSGQSKSASAKITTATIKKPTSVKVKAAKKKVTVSWKKAANATGYQVYRSTKKKSGYTLVGTITKGSTVKYVDKKAKAGTKYYYKVRAVGSNEAGIPIYSSYSTVKSVKAK